MRLHIIRHADPDYANDNLTSLGNSQAQALAAHMRNFPLKQIYSSPLGRAQATARYTAESTGIPVETLAWLREMDELKTSHTSNELPNPVVIWDLPGHELRQVRADEENLGASSDLFPQPQTINRFVELRTGWFEWLKRFGIDVTEEGWKTDRKLLTDDVAIFCHHGVGLALLSLIMDIPVAAMWRSIWLPPASVTTVLLEQYDRYRINPRLVCIGDTGHLTSSMRFQNTSGLLYNTR